MAGMSIARRLILGLALSLAIVAAAAAQEPEAAEETSEEVAAPVEEPATDVEEPAPDAADAPAEEPAISARPPPPGATSFTIAVEDESGPGQVEGWAGAMDGGDRRETHSSRTGSGSGSATPRSPATGRCTTT